MKRETSKTNINKDTKLRRLMRWTTIPVMVITSLILPKKKKVTVAQQNFKAEALKQKVDFGNIINSSFHSAALYDELKVKCHPDRFPTDKEKNQIAERLFKEITKNKTNFKKLAELKEQAEKLLNINF